MSCGRQRVLRIRKTDEKIARVRTYDVVGASVLPDESSYDASGSLARKREVQ